MASSMTMAFSGKRCPTALHTFSAVSRPRGRGGRTAGCSGGDTASAPTARASRTRLALASCAGVASVSTAQPGGTSSLGLPG